MKRIKYLDELRIFSILMIILLHVLGIFCYKYFGYTKSFLLMTFLSSFTRVGVPIFFMMTGILLFKKKDEDYFTYFKKRAMRLIVPFLFFSLVYYAYHIVTKTTTLSIFELVRQITSSNTEYHLWFMPVIITIYMFIPFLKKLVLNLDKKELKTLITLIFIMCNIFLGVQALTTVFGYSLMSSFLLPNLVGYTNYLFLGYYLEKYDYKISKRLIILSILSIIMIPICTLIVSRNTLIDVFLNSLSIFVVAPTILTFLFFKNKKWSFPKVIDKFCEKNANNVFYVYLIHVLIMNIIYNKFSKTIQSESIYKDIITIILLWIVVSILSFIFSKLWVFLKEWIKKNFDKITKICIKIFLGVMFILLIQIILNLVINPYHFIKLNYLATAISVIVLVGLFFLIEKINTNKVVNIIFMSFYIAFQILIAYMFMVKPSWDFGQVFNIAVDFAKNAHPTFGSAYLYVCDNNIIFSVILDLIYKAFYLIGIKSSFIEIGIVLNIIAIDVSLYFTYKLIKLINDKHSRAFMILTLFLSPLVFYIPIFYTDTLSLPFIIVPIYYLYKYFFLNQKISYIMVSGSMIGLGAMIKPTTLILFIAVLIYIVITENKKLNYYVFVPIMITLVVLPLLAQKVFVNHFFDKESLKKYRLPTIHYILIGMENNGEYSEERYREINSYVGEDTKKNVVKENIKKRIKEMTKNNEVLSFYNRKIAYTWTDGTFYSRVKLNREPVHEEYTKFVSSSDNNDTLLYWSISNGQWLLILLLMLSGICFRKYLSDNLKDFSLLLYIATFGVFLFLLIWETRSRYLVNYLPLFLVNAYIGLCALTNYKKQKRS